MTSPSANQRSGSRSCEADVAGATATTVASAMGLSCGIAIEALAAVVIGVDGAETSMGWTVGCAVWLRHD
jgi:hypothetical protein